MALDDSPATVVTSFNDGFVPSSVTADAFLPNRLRQSLGLLHNDRRLAREHEAKVLAGYSPREAAALKRALKTLIERTSG